MGLQNRRRQMEGREMGLPRAAGVGRRGRGSCPCASPHLVRHKSPEERHQVTLLRVLHELGIMSVCRGSRSPVRRGVRSCGDAEMVDVLLRWRTCVGSARDDRQAATAVGIPIRSPSAGSNASQPRRTWGWPSLGCTAGRGAQTHRGAHPSPPSLRAVAHGLRIESIPRPRNAGSGVPGAAMGHKRAGWAPGEPAPTCRPPVDTSSLHS